jgi:hypothetical protein
MDRKKIFLYCLFFAFIFACSHKKEKEVTAVSVSESPGTDTLPRKSITFILGKDESTRNPYYSLANDYYRLNDSDKTEIVIDTLISLLQVRDFLNTHRPENGRPWGLINLVTHGNEFIDLSVLVSPTGSRVSEKSLRKAIADSVFFPLDSTVIDKKTLFNLHGCAVGNNTALLNILSHAFGGERKVRFKASRMFEYYANLKQNKNPVWIRHYYSRVWYGYYRVDSLLDEKKLAAQLAMRYPADSVDWMAALQKQFPANPSEAYHINLNVPVVWDDYYHSIDSLPDLRTHKKQNTWLETKTEFLDLMKQTRIPRECFLVKFYRLNMQKDSLSFFVSRVKGMAGITCILQPVLSHEPVKGVPYPPLRPAENDSIYFRFSAE